MSSNHPEITGQVVSTAIWQANEPFKPEVITSVLKREPHPIRHPSFGAGFVWASG